MILTLAQARDHLRLDTTDADAELNDVIDAAEAAVMRYLKAETLDPVPADVVAATKLMVGYLWRLRDENADGEFVPGYLPAPVISLLYPLRDPSLA